MMDTFPDLGSLSDQELKDLIQQLTEEELEMSYRRRILHGKIDILRAELVNRLRKKHEGGEDVISGADVERLTDILAGRASGRRRVAATPRRSWRATAPNAASSTPTERTTASKCGAFLGAEPERRDDVTTATYLIGETRRAAAGRRRGRRGGGAARSSSAPAAAASARRSRSTASA